MERRLPSSGYGGAGPLAHVGSHFILELFDCPEALLNSARHVRASVRRAAAAASSTLLHEVSHKFHPQGVTAIALLAESHISIHTWPELGYAAADTFTCGDTTTPEKACEFLIEAFQARNYVLRKIERGPVLAAPPALVATRFGADEQGDDEGGEDEPALPSLACEHPAAAVQVGPKPAQAEATN